MNSIQVEMIEIHKMLKVTLKCHLSIFAIWMLWLSLKSNSQSKARGMHSAGELQRVDTMALVRLCRSKGRRQGKLCATSDLTYEYLDLASRQQSSSPINLHHLIWAARQAKCYQWIHPVTPTTTLLVCKYCSYMLWAQWLPPIVWSMDLAALQHAWHIVTFQWHYHDCWLLLPAECREQHISIRPRLSLRFGLGRRLKVLVVTVSQCGLCVSSFI